MRVTRSSNINSTIKRMNNTDIIRIPDDQFIDNDLPKTPKTLVSVTFPNVFWGIIENDSAILKHKSFNCDAKNSMVITIRKLSEKTPDFNYIN